MASGFHDLDTVCFKSFNDFFSSDGIRFTFVVLSFNLIYVSWVVYSDYFNCFS